MPVSSSFSLDEPSWHFDQALDGASSGHSASYYSAEAPSSMDSFGETEVSATGTGMTLPSHTGSYSSGPFDSLASGVHALGPPPAVAPPAPPTPLHAPAAVESTADLVARGCHKKLDRWEDIEQLLVSVARRPALLPGGPLHAGSKPSC